MLRLDAIKKLLETSKHPFASQAINNLKNLEFQVNVIPGIERIEGEFKGRRWNAYKYSDGEIAKPFRIPWKANKEPEYQDSVIRHNLNKIEAIGSTGWDWVNKKSLWFGFDFDSITGHKSGLSESELENTLDKIKQLPFIDIISSKSGKGFHVYLTLDNPIDTITHTEHASLARSILSYISSLISFDLKAKADVCGGNLWIYHSKVVENGFTVIKKSTESFNSNLVPLNWKSHQDVIENKTPKIRFTDNIDEITGSSNVPLDENHKSLLKFLQNNKAFSWWDSDRHMLVCHTNDLKKAKKELKLIGLFDTNSEGKETNDQNSFAFPLLNGGWIIRRHTKGVKEHPVWTDINGWTTTTLNVAPDLPTVSRLNNGNLDEKNNQTFPNYIDAIKALIMLGISIKEDVIPVHYNGILSNARIIRLKNGLLLSIDCQMQPSPMIEGFIFERKKLKKVFNIELPDSDRYLSTNDRYVRHLISRNKDAGWSLRNEKSWIQEPKQNIESYLLAKGIKDPTMIVGKAIENPWELVTLPFQPEYPGNRQWNKNAAQFSCVPTPGDYDTWSLLFNHVGKGLNDAVKTNSWCLENGITNGGEYLKCWVASLFQEPTEPLPYIFLFGPEKSGKSLFHESLSLFFKNNVGYVRADTALTNAQNFTGEMLGAVLCYTEEINLNESKVALQRIKNAVTSLLFNIHIKGQTPFDMINTTHWIQCANNPEFCPIMPGDTRICMIYVDKPEKEIPKSMFLSKLKDEAPAFLSYLLELELPKSDSRLRIPVIQTRDKQDQENANKTQLDCFIEEHCYEIEGITTPFNTFLREFHNYLPVNDIAKWSQQKVGRQFPKHLPRGRYPGTNVVHIGNFSLNKINPDGSEIKSGIKWVQVDDRIYPENNPKVIKEPVKEPVKELIN